LLPLCHCSPSPDFKELGSSEIRYGKFRAAKQLCEQASIELDGKKLIELTDQIIALFEKKKREER
jgi:hypothetical protein